MQAAQKTVLGKLTRMRRFLDRHTRALVAVNGSQARPTLDEIISSLEWYDSVQRAAFARSLRHTAHRRTLRKSLRTAHLRPIVEIARAKSDAVPMLSGLRMPDSDIRDTPLVFAALGIAKVVGDHRGVFLDLGFEDDFIDRLVAATHAVRAAEAQHVKYRMESADATRTIASIVSLGRRLARVLDALVLAKVGANTRLAAEWRTATTSHP